MIQRSISIGGINLTHPDGWWQISAATVRPTVAAHSYWQADPAHQYGAYVQPAAGLSDVVWPVRVLVYGADKPEDTRQRVDALITALYGTGQLAPIQWVEAGQAMTTLGRVRDVTVTEHAGVLTVVEARLHIPEPIWEEAPTLTTMPLTGTVTVKELTGGSAPTRHAWQLTGPLNSVTVRDASTGRLIMAYPARIDTGATVTVMGLRAYGRALTPTTPNDVTPPSGPLSVNVDAWDRWHPGHDGTYRATITTTGTGRETTIRLRAARSFL